jgi:hypothetical protein
MTRLSRRLLCDPGFTSADRQNLISIVSQEGRGASIRIARVLTRVRNDKATS